jgi:hypothetical protein
LAASYQSFAYVSFWPNAPVLETTAFDDKAEIQESEPAAVKPTFNIVCQHHQRQTEKCREMAYFLKSGQNRSTQRYLQNSR